MLPRLPEPWNELNVPPTQSILVGVVKDLGLGWDQSDHPPWWPQEVDYRHPKKSGDDIPKGKVFIFCTVATYVNFEFPYTGRWCQC